MPARPQMSIPQRLLLTRQVKIRKDDLFGGFNSKRTKETRRNAWKDLNDYANENAFPCGSTDGTTASIEWWWKNEVKAAKARADKMKKTGGGLESGETQFTEVQEAVLDALGRESAVVVGITDSAAASATSSSSSAHPNEDEFDETIDVLNATNGRPIPPVTPPAAKKAKKSKEDEKENWKLRLLKAKAVKAELEAYALERNLGLPTTNFIEIAEAIGDVEQQNSQNIFNDSTNI